MALSTPPDKAPLSLVQFAFNRIKDDILDGRHAPGRQISEHQLAEELGISRTPVREALRDLVSSGLARIIPQRGIIIRELSLDDIADMYLLRETLECLAIRIAVTRLNDAERDGYLSDHALSVAALQAGELRPAYDYAVRMHQRTVRLADSPRLSRFMSQIADEAHRYGLLTLRSGHAAQAIDEHGGIIEALVSGDGESAEALMLAHLQADRDLALKVALPIDGTGPAPIPPTNPNLLTA